MDKATRMLHLAPCKKKITAAGTALLLWKTVIRYHGIPRVIYSDRGAQFTATASRNCGELQELDWNLVQRITPNSRGGRTNERCGESDIALSDS